MNDDKTLALLASCLAYDRDLLGEGLGLLADKVMDTLQGTFESSVGLGVKITNIQAQVEILRRIIQLREALS